MSGEKSVINGENPISNKQGISSGNLLNRAKNANTSKSSITINLGILFVLCSFLLRRMFNDFSDTSFNVHRKIPLGADFSLFIDTKNAYIYIQRGGRRGANTDRRQLTMGSSVFF